MKLNEIRDNEGAHKRSRRFGRGIGSGRGKTCGRGGKGQTARTGVRIKGFEGGQMPIHRRLPKRGFNNPNRLDLVEVSLEMLQSAIDAGKIKSGDAITAASLKQAKVIKFTRDGLRLLGTGSLKSAITIEAHSATTSAKAAIEKSGGKVTETRESREAPTNSFEARRAKAKETAAKAAATRAASAKPDVKADKQKKKASA